MSVNKYQKISDSNVAVGDGVSTVGIQEGMPRRDVNNAMRSMCSDIAKYAEDNQALTTLGSSDVFAVTTASEYVGYSDKMSLWIEFHADVNGAAVINVNNLGEKPILTNIAGVVGAVGASQILAGEVYKAVYNGTGFVISGASNLANDVAALDAKTIAFSDRNPANATKAIAQGDGVKFSMDGLFYETNSAKTGAQSVTNDLSADGVVAVSNNGLISLKQFGVTGAGDETAKVQAAIDWCAAENALGGFFSVLIDLSVEVTHLTNPAGVPIVGTGWRLNGRPEYGSANWSTDIDGAVVKFTATSGIAYDHGTNTFPRPFGGGIKDVAFVGSANAGVTGINWQESLHEYFNNMLVANFEVGENFDFVQEAHFGVHHSIGNKKSHIFDGDSCNDVGYDRLYINSCGDASYSDAGYAYGTLSGDPIFDVRNIKMLTIQKILTQNNAGPVLSADTTRYTGSGTALIQGLSIKNLYAENGTGEPQAQLLWCDGNLKACEFANWGLFGHVNHMVLKDGVGYFVSQIHGIGASYQGLFVESSVTDSTFNIVGGTVGVGFSENGARNVSLFAGLIRSQIARVTGSFQSLIKSSKQTPPAGYVGAHGADNSVVGVAANPALAIIEDDGTFATGAYPN